MSQKLEEWKSWLQCPPRDRMCLTAGAIMGCFRNLNDNCKLPVYLSMHWEGVVCVTEQGRGSVESFGNDGCSWLHVSCLGTLKQQPTVLMSV